MRIEERADGLHIFGYVNVTGKLSKPLTSPTGAFVETIDERAFSKALSKSGNVKMTVDHEPSYVIAETEDHSLVLEEDAIGLRAHAKITDKLVIESAKMKRIRGWSFGMREIVDEMEQRAEGQLPLRHIKDFVLDHVTLVIQKVPCYAATSVECRAGDEVSIECRSFDAGIINVTSGITEKPDLTEYENRIKSLERKDVKS